MKMLIEHDSDKIQLQQQKLFENLNDLYSSGKLTGEQFEDIKKQIYKTLSFKKKQKTLSDDKIKSEAFILDKKLESVLSDDDYASISNDIEILKIHIENNSDDSIQLQDKLLNKLQNLKNSGKLTGPMYDSIKKSLEKTILLSKDRNKSVGDTVTIEQKKLKQKLKIKLTDDDFASLSNDLILLTTLVAENSNEVEQQEDVILQKLQALLDVGKLSTEELNELKNSVLQNTQFAKIQTPSIEDIKKSQNEVLDQNLKAVLSDDDYTSFSNELEVLKSQMENNSEEAELQSEKVLNNLENMYNTGKIGEKDYNKLKNSIQQTISVATAENQMKIKSDTDKIKLMLHSVLSADDYEVIAGEIDLTHELIKNKSNDSLNQKKVVLDKLSNLFHNGKLRGKKNYENLQKLLNDNLSLTWDPKNSIELKTDSILDQQLKNYLEADVYTSINNELDDMKFSVINNLEDARLKEQAVFKKLENLHEQGEIFDAEYEELKQLVHQSLALLGKENILMAEEIDQENVLDSSLESVLSNDDYMKINSDLEELKKHILSNSETSLEHEQKLMNELSDIYSAGKLTDDEYEKVKKSVKQSIAISKKEKEYVDIVITDTSSKQATSRTTETPLNIYIKEQPSPSALSKN